MDVYPIAFIPLHLASAAARGGFDVCGSVRFIQRWCNPFVDGQLSIGIATLACSVVSFVRLLLWCDFKEMGDGVEGVRLLWWAGAGFLLAGGLSSLCCNLSIGRLVGCGCLFRMMVIVVLAGCGHGHATGVVIAEGDLLYVVGVVGSVRRTSRPAGGWQWWCVVKQVIASAGG